MPYKAKARNFPQTFPDGRYPDARGAARTLQPPDSRSPKCAGGSGELSIGVKSFKPLAQESIFTLLLRRFNKFELVDLIRLE